LKDRPKQSPSSLGSTSSSPRPHGGELPQPADPNRGGHPVRLQHDHQAPEILDGIVSGSETYLAIEAITGKTPAQLTGFGHDFAMFNTPEHLARRKEQMDKLTVSSWRRG
jgi:hypothetical protein